MRRPWLALMFGIVATSCGKSSSPPPAPSACAPSDALVAMSDYSSSGVGAIALDGGEVLSFGAALGKDPALSVSNGRAFYVARQEGTVFEIDPQCGSKLAEFDVDDPGRQAGTNPQDVAVAPDGALWVPRYNVPNLAIVHGGAIDTIDLSSYDADGNPQASAIRILDVNGAAKAFVTLERLDDHDRLLSKQPSMMLVIDVATRAPERTVTLVGRNPFNTIVSDGGGLFLAMPGNFDAANEPDAGVERFDAATSTTRLLARETDFGASVSEVAVHGRCGVVILADAVATVNATSLATFDAETGAVLARDVIGKSETFDLGLRGLAWVNGGGVLLVGDRKRAAGGYPVHAFTADDTCTLHALPDAIFLTQKPVSVRSAK